MAQASHPRRKTGRRSPATSAGTRRYARRTPPGGRRLAGAALALAGVLTAGPAAAEPVEDAAARLEAELGGRIGVLLREAGGVVVAWRRPDERFPLNSAVKALLCGAVLARVDAGGESLDRAVAIHRDDIVSHSPVVERRIGGRTTVGELRHATPTESDTATASLLLESVGGPAGVTAVLRTPGDGTTRVDRDEPAMNEGRPGDLRDTTTPKTVLSSLEALSLGDALTPASRARLHERMAGNAVADALIRASLPTGWSITGRSGAGGFGSRSIIAPITPPEGAPTLAAIYLTGTDFAMRDAAIAEIGGAMIDAIAARSTD